MPDTPVLRENEDGVLLLTLNRPEKKNAFNDPQWDGLRDALNEAREDPSVAVVVLTGAGKDFSTGQDLAAFGAASEPRPDGRPSGFYGCAEALGAFDQPRVAAELFYTAEWITASRALETGIVTSVHPDAEVLPVALTKAREIAKHPVSSLQATKRTLLASRAAGVAAAFEAEDAGMKAQAGSPENVEAVRAFLEKRPPDFAQFRKAKS